MKRNLPPTVSVCVPAYNSGRYLGECLSSVLAQTFWDFELLVVDDCSTDDTEVAVRRAAGNDQRLRYTRNPSNLGMVRNWNRCAELARGEWVKFVFADDLIAPACLEKMLAHAAGDAPLIACRREIFWGGSGAPDETLMRFYRWHQDLVARLYPRSAFVSPDAFARLVVESPELNVVGEPTCTLIRRAALKEHGPFDEDMAQIVDLELWDRIATNGGMVFVAETLAKFRSHPESATARNAHDAARETLLDRLILLEKLTGAPAYARFRSACTEAQLDALAGRAASLRRQLADYLERYRAGLKWAGIAEKYVAG